MLNMKDINKILAKTHFKCKYKKKIVKKPHIFAKTCLYDAVGSLPAQAFQGSPHLQKTGRLDFFLRDHEGEVKAWQGDFQQHHRDMFSQKCGVSSHFFFYICI
jgi:hypothetical protein